MKKTSRYDKIVSKYYKNIILLLHENSLLKKKTVLKENIVFINQNQKSLLIPEETA